MQQVRSLLFSVCSLLSVIFSGLTIFIGLLCMLFSGKERFTFL
ncbi:hypothetical protein HMPREF1141_0147 [Clostridium sp. MSTE9]|nr:hypothetical protein HMPREF1141_0147 [Clostridium sp. MSTE9]